VFLDGGSFSRPFFPGGPLGTPSPRGGCRFVIPDPLGCQFVVVNLDLASSLGCDVLLMKSEGQLCGACAVICCPIVQSDGG